MIHHLYLHQLLFLHVRKNRSIASILTQLPKGNLMFIKIDKNTLEEETSSEEMVTILETDLRKSDDVDEVLTEIVMGIYEHSTASAIYKYKS